MFSIMGTLHAANRILERNVPIETTTVGANLARHLLSAEPKRVWHNGVEIVAVLTDEGHPKILTAWNEDMPAEVAVGLNAVSSMLTDAPLQFRYMGYNILAKKSNGTPTAVLVWKGARHG